MLRTGPATPIISPCSRLVWAASRQPDVMEVINRIDVIDDAVRRAVMAEAPAIKFKGLAVRSGAIEGVIDAAGNKLLYVAVSYDDEPTDSHLLHVQRQLADLNARRETHLHLQECFMLVVNKCTGRVKERVIPYCEDFVFDFQHIIDQQHPGPEVVNSCCQLCPLRFDCDSFEKHQESGK